MVLPIAYPKAGEVRRADLGEVLPGGSPGNTPFRVGDMGDDRRMAITLGGGFTTRCHEGSHDTPPLAPIQQDLTLPSAGIINDRSGAGGYGGLHIEEVECGG